MGGLIPERHRDWRLTLGSLVIAEKDPLWHPDGYRINTDAQDFRMGSPVPIWQAVASLLQDGTLREKERDDNRSFGWFVTIEGKDGRGLALGVQALELELGRPNLVTWKPPQPTAATGVYEVQASWAEEAFDDFDELQTKATLRLNFEALPFVRSENPVTISFSTANAPTVAIADGATSDANWAPAWDSTSVSQVTYQGASAIRVQAPIIPNPSYPDYDPWRGRAQVGVRWMGTLPDAPYFVVDVLAQPWNWPPTLMTPGWTYGQPPTASAPSPEGTGYMRYWFRNETNAALVNPQVRLAYQTQATTGTADVWVAGIGTSNVAPSSGVLAASIEGSQRTPLSLSLSASAALGDLVISQDPTYLSHGWTPTDQQQYAPDGTYILFAGGADGDVFEVTEPSGRVKKVRLHGTVAGWRPLCLIALGGNRDGRVGASWGYTVKKVGDPSPTSLPSESYPILRKHKDAVHLVTASLTKKVFTVDIPSLERDRGGIWQGDQADLSDATSAWHLMTARQWPNVRPPMASFWTNRTAAFDLNGSYYPKFGHRVVGSL